MINLIRWFMLVSTILVGFGCFSVLVQPRQTASMRLFVLLIWGIIILGCYGWWRPVEYKFVYPENAEGGYHHVEPNPVSK